MGMAGADARRRLRLCPAAGVARGRSVHHREGGGEGGARRTRRDALVRRRPGAARRGGGGDVGRGRGGGSCGVDDSDSGSDSDGGRRLRRRRLRNSSGSSWVKGTDSSWAPWLGSHEDGDGGGSSCASTVGPSLVLEPPSPDAAARTKRRWRRRADGGCGDGDDT